MEKDKSKPPRRDWEYNHELLAEAFMKHIMVHGRPPTYAALHRDTGFAIDTIKRHLDELDKKTLGKRLRKFKVLTGDIIASLSLKAKQGDTQAAKLYLEIVEQFKEGKEIDLTMNGMSREDKEKLLGKIIGGEK